MDEVAAYVKNTFAGKECVTTVSALTGVSMVDEKNVDPILFKIQSWQ